MKTDDRRIRVRVCELPIRGGWSLCIDRALKACSAPPLPHLSVLPELFTIGFRLERISASALEPGMLESLPLADLAGDTGTWIVGGSFPVKTPRGIINTMPVFDPGGKLAHTAEKMHLFRRMGEDTVFTGGKASGVFPFMAGKAGAAVCYDLRFPEVFRPLTLGGATMLIVSAQWPGLRRSVFRCLLQARSAEAQVFTVGCNLGGSHLGTRFGGGGGVVTPGGEFLRGERVMPGVTDYDVDMSQVEDERNRIDCLADRRPEAYTRF